MLIALFSFTSAANVALQNLMESQEVTTLSTVKLDGKSVLAKAKDASALHVCGSLGFTRLVNAENEAVYGNELINRGETEYLVTSSESGAVRYKESQVMPKRYYTILKTVTCAK